MRLISWQGLGIIASVIWVVVAPTYFHLSKEDNDKRIARDQSSIASNKLGRRKRMWRAAIRTFGRLLPLPTGAVGLNWHLFRWRWGGAYFSW